MFFCLTARGPCTGRANCRLWIRGRILYTDSKLLAAQLARFTLNQDYPKPPATISSQIREAFWQNQGIPNIRRETLIDRYLREKIAEVEILANKWIQSPGFHEITLDEKQAKIKASSALQTQRCKSPL